MFPKERRIVSLTFLSTIGISLWTNLKVEYFFDGSLKEYNTVSRFLIYCRNSLNGDKLLTTFLAVMTFCLLIKVDTYVIDVRTKRYAMVFSILFSIMQMVGKSYTLYNSWVAIFGGKFIFFRFIVALAGITVVVYHIVLLVIYLIKKYQEKEYSKRCLFERGEKGSNRSRFVAIVLWMVICWLPYYILFFPGTGNGDTGCQIQEFFQYPTKLLKLTSLQGENILATNHNPYFLTLLFGSFIKLGLFIGKAEYGLAIYCFLQMFLTALTFTAVFYYLYKTGISERYINYGLYFVAFFPVFPLYAICMVKDSVFSPVCLILTILLFEIGHSEDTRGEVKNRNWYLLSIIVLLFELTKNQGVYFAVVIMCVYVVCNSKYRKQILFSFGVPILFFLVVWMRMILPALNVAPGGRQELRGFIFQQTARYMVEYQNDVTEYEKGVISSVLDYDHWTENYDPTLQDPVKYTFNQSATTEMLNDYYRVWWKMFLRHPDSYIQATLNNTYGFFYINRNSSIAYLEFSNRGKQENELTIYESKWHDQVYESVKEIIRTLHRVPMINILFCVQLYVWIVIAYIFWVFCTKQYHMLLPAMVAVLSMGILIVSPANGNFRYTMPLLYMSPFLLCVMLSKMKVTEIEIVENSKNIF